MLFHCHSVSWLPLAAADGLDLLLTVLQAKLGPGQRLFLFNARRPIAGDFSHLAVFQSHAGLRDVVKAVADAVFPIAGPIVLDLAIGQGNGDIGEGGGVACHGVQVDRVRPAVAP